ncbi:MAG: beta-hexosaminidase [Oscillibacter sp.]|jgi:beta-N-acetylhexosaminidase|nr:beta-hexosaminidase [Oscillibacter sp.]
MKHAVSLLMCFLMLVTLTACGQDAEAGSGAGSSSDSAAGASQSAAASSQPAAPEVDPTEERIAELLSGMTVEQKVGQLFFVRVPAESAAEDVKTYHLGGYLLFGRDFKDKTANEIIQAVNAYQETAADDTGIPLLIGVDEEGGTVVRISSNPHLRSEKFKSPQQLYAAGGMDAVVRETHEKDVLLRALGINVNLSPVCDVSTNSGDFMYARTFGQDAQATAGYVESVVGQMGADGMGSVLKHFPGYGNNADTHTGISVDGRPLDSFQSSDFLPFSAGMQAGKQTGSQVAAVLVSHNIVQCMDADLPASLSPAVHKILREELGFDGVVMTDDLAMDAVKAYAADGNVATMAISAGNDLVITTDYRDQIPQVVSAVQDGTISQETLDTAVSRVLAWKAALGLL